MKIFIRASQMSDKNPQVVASYSSDSPVAADAHPDTIMLEVPELVLVQAPMPHLAYSPIQGDRAARSSSPPPPHEPFPRLPDGWREKLADPILQAEAKRRIDEVLPPLDQVATLHEMIDLILRYGVDSSSWPAEAKDRKAEIDDAWRYLHQVKERVRSLRALPANPASDRNWPTRIAKRG